jgi:hypothetical protein
VKASLIVVGLAAAFTFPAGALAATCAPPGTSGVDQYFETVPGIGCSVPSSGPGGPAGGGHRLPPGTTRQLGAQGRAGRAVERLFSSTGAASGSARLGSGGSGAARAVRGPALSPAPPGVTARSADGRSLPWALLHPIVAGSPVDGAGVLLPIFLACALLIAVCAMLLRLRPLRRTRG